MKTNILTFFLGFGLSLLIMNPVAAQEQQPRQVFVCPKGLVGIQRKCFLQM